MTIVEFKRRFEPLLHVFVREKLSAYRSYTSDRFVLSLLRHAERLVLADGKRVRPYVAYLMYKTAGGRDDGKALRFFIALEVCHSFALMHDDVIDRSSERRGVPTIHVHTKRLLKRLNRVGPHEHLGYSFGILVGDLLLAWVTELMSSAEFSKARVQRMRHFMHRLIDEVMIGEMVDVDTSTRPKVPTVLIDEKMLLKTARYSFVRPMQVGVGLAGGSKKLERFCEAFGKNLGIAFQIQDDLFDLTVSSRQLGKPVMTDLETHQHTVFTQFIAEHGTARERRELKRYFGKKLSVRGRKAALRLFDRSGSLDDGRFLMAKRFATCRRLVRSSTMPTRYRQAWLDVVDLLATRTS